MFKRHATGLISLSLMLAGSLSSVLSLSIQRVDMTPSYASERRGSDVSQLLHGYFTENRGQVAKGVRYYGTGNPSVAFGDSGIIFVITETRERYDMANAWSHFPGKSAPTAGRDERVSSFSYLMRFDAANLVTPVGRGRASFDSNFFIGNDPSRWKTGVPSYTEVVYENLYDGIDLVYHQTANGLKYEFDVRAGADPGTIRMAYEGVKSFTVDEKEVRLGTPLGDIRDVAPHSYQEDGKEIECGFVAREPGTYGFRCAGRDPSKRLVIDPLVYSTFLGGSSWEEPGSWAAVAVDGQGNAYVTGCTESIDFPITFGAFDMLYSGARDAFVAKLNPLGNGLVYSTYLGGSGADLGESVAVDESGNAYVVGNTFSSDFPVTAGAFNTSRNGINSTTFVTKLNATGETLDYSTYLGGEDEGGHSIAIDAEGSAFVAGYTRSATFPVTSGAFDTTYNGNTDAFVVKLNQAGSALSYSTFLGGSESDVAWSIAVDAAGEVVVSGGTNSMSFPTTAGAFDTSYNGGGDVFVAKLDRAGNSLLFSTFLGGSLQDGAYNTRVALDSGEEVYLASTTSSTDFPVTAGTYDTTYNGGTYDTFVTKLDQNASVLLYSTYLGGSSNDDMGGLAVSYDDEAFLVGTTCSSDFPTTSGALETSFQGSCDAFITEINTAGNALKYSTFLGGTAWEEGTSIALDPSGNIYAAGDTDSADFPVTPGAFDRIVGGPRDAFVTKLNFLPDLELSPVDISFLPPGTATAGTPVIVNATVYNIGEDNASQVAVRFFDGPPPGLDQIGTDQTIGFIGHFGGTGNVSVTWIANPSGDHSICVVADPDDRILESDESNNQACAPIRVVPPPIPDLAVLPTDIVLSPLPPYADGTIVRVNATVRNIGGAASAATTAGFYDGVPPSPRIGSDQPLNPISEGGSQNVSVTWTASPPGSHEICVVADPDNLVAELNETNNMACVPVTVLSLPDLKPLNLNVTPPSPLLDSTVVQVNVTVRNEGDLSAGGFDTLFFDDKNGNGLPDGGETIGSVPLSSLAGHFPASISVAWTATPPGSHRVCAYADPPLGKVTESNETNNVMCINVLVQPGPVLRPDYVPVFPLPLPPIRVGMSMPILLSIQVLNQGNGTATDNAMVAFYEQSSSPFSTFVLSPLAPAATSSRFTATWTSPATPGTYMMSVDVDHGNNVTEWDETNNIYTWTIEVVSGPLTSLLIGTPNYTSILTHLTYVRSSTHLDFSVTDQSGTGIRNTTYRIDGRDWANYTATGQFVLAGEGQHEIEWYSEDYSGNVETVVSTNLTVDGTPPATAISPATEEVDAGTLFSLDATDAGSGVNHTEYMVDGGQWIRYTDAFALPEGRHNISYRSVDNLGNVEDEKYLDVTVLSPYVPPAIEANYKPLVALVFAIILTVVGLWSSKRRPWKEEKDRMAVMKAFAITSMPFVVAEAVTGFTSFLTGKLSIPPPLGLGLAVDLTILVLGCAVAIVRVVKGSPRKGK